MADCHECRIISFLKSLPWTERFGNSVDHDVAKILTVLINDINTLDNCDLPYDINDFLIC